MSISAAFPQVRSPLPHTHIVAKAAARSYKASVGSQHYQQALRPGFDDASSLFDRVRV
jgi:hypothetical protein